MQVICHPRFRADSILYVKDASPPVRRSQTIKSRQLIDTHGLTPGKAALPHDGCNRLQSAVKKNNLNNDGALLLQGTFVHRVDNTIRRRSTTMAKKSQSLKKSLKSQTSKRELSPEQREELLGVLKARFDKNMNRHKGVEWAKVRAKLEAHSEKLWSINEMERTGGEPDVVGDDKRTSEYTFCDCSAESPSGRRSVCYDRDALESRKEHKPGNSAMDMAAAMGIELLTEEQYRELQRLGHFDEKTSSWVHTPADIRKLGGALFCDRRYDTVFVYHNGADSYYAARAFRGLVKV